MCKPSYRPTVLTESLEPRQLLSTTFYVDASSPGPTHNGSSWSTAYTDLQLALATATSGDTIKVAQGTYKPTSTTDRSISFTLKSGVSIYGSYAGSSSSTPDAHDTSLYSSTLSGEIASPNLLDDNSYHILNGSSADSTALLDGFVVTSGFPNFSGSDNAGSSFYAAGGSPTIANCTFTSPSNYPAAVGAFIYNNDASTTFTHCTFSNHQSNVVISNAAGATPVIFDCTFSNNSAGSIYNSSSSPIINSCIFIHNTGTSSPYAGLSGGITNISSSPLTTNCTFIRNSAPSGGAIYDSSSHAAPTIAGCLFLNNFTNAAHGQGGAIYDSSQFTSIVNCTFYANISVYGGAIFTLSSSGLIANCILWADSALYSPEIYQGSPITTSNCDIQNDQNTLSANPLFYRNPSPGPDNTWGTPDDDFGDLHLLPNSPAIDTGSNAAVPSTLTTDLSGNPRIVDFPGIGPANTPVVDMGVYEASTNLGSLHLTSSQSVSLPPGGYSFTATQLILDPGATLDLADNSLILTNPPDLASIRQSLASKQLFSSNSTPNHSIAYATASDLGLTTFNSQPIPPTALLLKYTLTGDANLDGRINADDYALTDRGLAKNSSVWTAGDFNYDGTVTSADLTLLDQSNASLQPPATPNSQPLAAPALPASAPTFSIDQTISKITSKKAGVVILSIKISKSLKTAIAHNALLRIYFSHNAILDKKDTLVLTKILPKNLKANSHFNLRVKIPPSLANKPWHILAVAKPKR